MVVPVEWDIPLEAPGVCQGLFCLAHDRGRACVAMFLGKAFQHAHLVHHLPESKDVLVEGKHIFLFGAALWVDYEYRNGVLIVPGRWEAEPVLLVVAVRQQVPWAHGVGIAICEQLPPKLIYLFWGYWMCR